MQRRDYLSLLPALFRRGLADAGDPAQGTSGSFLASYLDVWQALLSDPEPARGADNVDLVAPLAKRASLSTLIQALPALFHPRLSPAFLADDPRFLPPLDLPPSAPGTSHAASPEAIARGHLSRLLGSHDIDAWFGTYLGWYGQMLDTPVPRGWQLDAKRRLLSQILPVYRLRGTPAGLRQLLELLVTGERSSDALTVSAQQAPAAPSVEDALAATSGEPAPASAAHLDDLVGRALSEPDAALFLEDRIRSLYAQLYGPDPASYAELLARVQARVPGEPGAAPVDVPAEVAPNVSGSGLAMTSTPADGAQALDLPQLVLPKPVPDDDVPLVEVLDGALGLRDAFRLDRSVLQPGMPERDLDGYELGQFQVFVSEPTRNIDRLLRIQRWLTRVVETEKPLGTRFHLALRTPTLVVGDSYIGRDTVLGDARLNAAPTSSSTGSPS